MNEESEQNEEELEHYGVRGMHWGVRRAAGSTSRKAVDTAKKVGKASGRAAVTGSKAGGRAVIKLHERRREQMRTQPTKPPVGSRKVTAKGKSVYKASPKRLTDEQLQNRIKRMELEKKYNELNQRTSSSGKKFVSKVLNDSGTQVATSVLSAAGLYGVKKGLEGQMGAEKVAAMFPKKK